MYVIMADSINHENNGIKMSDILKRFTKLSQKMDTYNGRNRCKRLFPVTHAHNHRIVEIGVYDGKTKKWAITDIRAHNAESVMKEMEKIVRDA